MPFAKLDRYDQFYRISCYPLHCLQAHAFFAELDQLQRIVDVTIGCRMDCDLVPVQKFNEYYFEGAALWSKLLKEKECVIRRMFGINGLFTTKRELQEENELEYLQTTARKHQSTDHSLNDSVISKEGMVAMKSIDGRELTTPITEEIELPKGSFNQMDELEEMFKQQLEPSFVRTDQGIMRKDGKTMPLEASIDIFTLKMLSLLMCRDQPKIKAQLFIEAVIGRAGVALGREYLSINNSKLKKGVKLLFFFAEIFPKKYEYEFETELKDAKNEGDYNQNVKQDLSDDEISPQVSNQKSTPMSEVEWRQDYIQCAEKFVIECFDDIYEEIFVQGIFGQTTDFSTKYDSSFHRKQFISNAKEHAWLFDPAQLRQKLKDNMEVLVE